MTPPETKNARENAFSGKLLIFFDRDIDSRLY
jgi:hypothetical protein